MSYSTMCDSELIVLPAGVFIMGETEGDKFSNDTERPRHQVTIHSFRLARFPVTNGAFRKFRPEFAIGKADELPATGVTWHDAVGFCNWLSARSELSLRLPTEAEWEYAARAGTSSIYPWGDEIPQAAANYLYSEDGSRVGLGYPTPMGTYPPNAYHVYDLLGNVAEWTGDHWHPNYHGAPSEGAEWITPSNRNHKRVVRGGAWDYLPRLLRPSWRDSCDENRFRDNLGFRVASSFI